MRMKRKFGFLSLLAALAAAPGCGATLTAISLGVITNLDDGDSAPNQPTTVVITSIDRAVQGQSLVTRARFVVADAESDPATLAVLFRIPGTSFAAAAIVGGPGATQDLATSPAGVPHEVFWDQAQDLGPDAVPGAELKIGDAVSPPFTAGNEVPVVSGPRVIDSDDDAATPLSGFIPLEYALVDGESDLCSVRFQFTVDGTNFFDMTLAFGESIGVTSAPPGAGGAPHTILWNSIQDMVVNATQTGVPEASDSVRFRIAATDPFAGGPEAMLGPFSVANSSRPAAFVSAPALGQVVGQAEEETPRVLVSFFLTDAEDPFISVALSFDTGSGPQPLEIDEIDGTPVVPPIADGRIPTITASTLGAFHSIRWVSTHDVNPPDFATVRIRAIPSDRGGAGAPAFSSPFALNNNEEPTIQSLDEPVFDPLTGKVTVTYRLADPEGNPAHAFAGFLPLLGGEPVAVTATSAPGEGDGTLFLEASPLGTPHTFVWDSAADIPGPTVPTAQALVIFAMLPIDATSPNRRLGDGDVAFSVPFVIDNTVAPSATFPATYIRSDTNVTNLDMAAGRALHKDVEITFTLADFDVPPAASLTAFIEFSLEGGAEGTYRPMLLTRVDNVNLPGNGIRGEVPGLAPGTHAVVWPSRADGVGTPIANLVRIRVRPKDSKLGITAESPAPLAFDNGFFSLTAVPIQGVFQDRIPIGFFLAKQNELPQQPSPVEVQPSFTVDINGIPFKLATEALPSGGGSAIVSPVASGAHVFVWNSFFDLQNEPSLIQPNVTFKLVAQKLNTLELDVRLENVFTFSVDNGAIVTVAGGGRIAEGVDVEAAPRTPADFTKGAFLRLPHAVAAFPDGNLLVVDTADHVIRFVNRGLAGESIAGQFVPPLGIATLAGGGRSGLGDGLGGRLAELNYPTDAALDLSFGTFGRILICDTANERVRALDLATTRISTVAGGEAPGTVGRIELPTAIAVTAVAIVNGIGTAVPVGAKTRAVFVEGTASGRVFRIDDESGQVEPVAGGGGVTDVRFHFPAPAPPTPQFVAGFEFANGVAIDGDGNILVADNSPVFGGRVKRIERATGFVTRIAGRGSDSLPPPPSRQGPARDVALFTVGRIAVAPNGLVLVPTLDGLIYAVSTQTSGTLSAYGVPVGPLEARIVAGTGAIGSDLAQPNVHGDGGPALAADLADNRGCALAPGGDLLIAVGAQGRIRRVAAVPVGPTSSAIVTTVAGHYDLRPIQDQDPGPDTFLAEATSVATVPTDGGPLAGSILVADPRRRLAPADTTGVGVLYRLEAQSGLARAVTSVALWQALIPPGPDRPDRIEGIRAAGTAIYTAHGDRIFRWTRSLNDSVTPPARIAGGGLLAPVDGLAATSATLLGVRYLAVAPTGNAAIEKQLFFSESGRHRVWRIDAGGFLRLVAGDAAGVSGTALPFLGSAADVELDAPRGLDFDSTDGTALLLLVCDALNHRIIRIDATAGAAPSGWPADLACGPDGLPGESGFGGDFFGPTDPLVVLLDEPSDIRTLEQDHYLFADRNNHRIRRFRAFSQLGTAGGGFGFGFFGDGTPPGEALLFLPDSLDVDRFGNVFVADGTNARIRRFVPPPF